MCSQNPNEKHTPAPSDELEGLSPHQRKLKLLAKMENSAADLARFWSKVDKRSLEDCWEWKISLNTDGYGQFKFTPKGLKKVNFQAHQIAYFLHHGTIPEGLCVCHHCDNRKCNNPYHLFIGTQGDNIRDRDRKGRHVAMKGVQNKAAVLNEYQVQQVRLMWFVGKKRAEEIAAIFGTSRGCINGIVYGYNWRHLPMPIECF